VTHHAKPARGTAPYADGVADKLYQSYPQIFEKLDVFPAPLLIRVDGAELTALGAENGADAGPVPKEVYETIQSYPGSWHDLLQQTNFRLRSPVSAKGRKLWFYQCHPPGPFRAG
jgi:hypothetical protein